MSSNGFLKRLEKLEAAIKVRTPRVIVVAVPTGKDGVTAETEAAVAEIEQGIAVTSADLVVRIARFGSELEIPKLLSIN